jgi:4-amino-4-deoxy-L-arabinose transferase-like glycosyltransferase
VCLGIAVLLAAAVLGLGIARGSRSVGGADVYGYVSQADLLRQGALRIHQPMAAEVPWPEPDWTLAPLGYVPGGGHTIVPVYPPGLPILIVLFSLVFGSLGPFLVAPVCAAALVLLTYALGARMAGPLVGLAAAAGVATSPTVLFIMLTPMSDVPVAAFWMASLLLALGRTPARSVAAGVFAGVAILIRPNLVFLATLPLLVTLWRADDPGRRLAMHRAAAFALASAPFAIFMGWWFNTLHGSPLRSGYADNADLFALAWVRDNLARYPAWLWQTQGPLVFLAPLSPLVALRHDDRFIRTVGVVLIAMVTLFYLVYAPFDAWWFLRFFVVAFPILFILSADVVRAAVTRVAPRAVPLALGVFTAAVVSHGVASAWRLGVPGAERADRRYADVGRFVRASLPPKAVVYSMQHSGTIRYHAGRLTLRWTHMKTDWLDPSIDYWLAAGYEPAILLEDWEVPLFLERFGSTARGAAVAATPADAPCTYPTFLYRLVERPGLENATRVPRADCE